MQSCVRQGSGVSKMWSSNKHIMAIPGTVTGEAAACFQQIRARHALGVCEGMHIELKCDTHVMLEIKQWEI